MFNVITVVVDGIAYGMLLFLLAVGLSVTLGLMRFINLAHGAFAMGGGYLAMILTNRVGLPFLAVLPITFVAVGLVGLVLERSGARHLYRVSALRQVLFTIGFAFAMSAFATILFGPQQQAVRLPNWFSARVPLWGVEIAGYRLFLIVVGTIIATALAVLFDHTLWGARIRAAVDNRRAAEGIGINVERLFAITFGLGTGLAGLGGALSIEFLGLDPTFAFKYLTVVLMVVAVGGAGSIEGPILAALLLGIADGLFKYFLPEAGSFVIFGLFVTILVFLPAGLRGRTT